MPTAWKRLLDRLATGEVTIGADEVRRWDKHQWQEVLGLGLLPRNGIGGGRRLRSVRRCALGRGLLGDAWRKGLFRVRCRGRH